MTRIRPGLALIVGAALALVVLGPASARTDAGQPYGGVLVVGLGGGDPAALDPTTIRGGSALVVEQGFCQRLYGYDAKQQLIPILATALPVLSTDKLSYTIQLRQGLQFNDGTPFNAQAVVATIQRFISYPGSSRASDYAGVDSVTTSGQYTVVYHLKGRDSSFTGSNPYVLSPTQVARLGDNFASNPVCVGPFMFDHRVPGDNVTVIKSPYYYDKGNVYLDKIVYKPVPDAAAAAAALKAGDIQALDNVSSTDLPSIQASSSLRVIQAPQLGWSGVFFNIGNRGGIGNLPYTNVGTPLASSAKLRQAFEEAIDRDTMSKVVFGGLVQATCTPIPPANIAFYDATEVACTPYNPTDAKKLVAASGFPSPTVRLLTSNATANLRLAQFIQAQEAAVGINVVIDPTDSATAGTRSLGGSYDAYLGGLEPGSPDPFVAVYRQLATSGAANYAGYSNGRMDLILANTLKATSTTARATLYHAAQQIWHDDRPSIVLYNVVSFAAFSANVTGLRLDYRGIIDVANARFK